MYNERRAREEDTPASMDMLEEEGFDTEGVEVSVHAFQVRVCNSPRHICSDACVAAGWGVLTIAYDTGCVIIWFQGWLLSTLTTQRVFSGTRWLAALSQVRRLANSNNRPFSDLLVTISMSSMIR